MARDCRDGFNRLTLVHCALCWQILFIYNIESVIALIDRGYNSESPENP
jgi:hypothetical protein